jgi:hormone-sensitive lipase
LAVKEGLVEYSSMLGADPKQHY